MYSFLGRTSTSSAKYQDDLFNKAAVPPSAINVLGEENRKKWNCRVLHYDRFKQRWPNVNCSELFSRC